MIDIKVTLPKKKIASKKWLDSIATVQRQKSIPRLRKLFNETVFGWSTKPKMGWSQSKGADEISIKIYPTGAGADKWDLVNQGSPAHIIRPKRQFLSFRPGYRSATRPGMLRSRRKYRSGNYVTAGIVKHPGFEPRKFTELIAQEFASEFGMEMQEAVTEAALRD